MAGMSCEHRRVRGFGHPWADLCYAHSEDGLDWFMGDIGEARAESCPAMENRTLHTPYPLGTTLSDDSRFKIQDLPLGTTLSDDGMQVHVERDEGDRPPRIGWVAGGPSDAHNQVSWNLTLTLTLTLTLIGC